MLNFLMVWAQVRERSDMVSDTDGAPSCALDVTLGRAAVDVATRESP